MGDVEGDSQGAHGSGDLCCLVVPLDSDGKGALVVRAPERVVARRPRRGAGKVSPPGKPSPHGVV